MESDNPQLSIFDLPTEIIQHIISFISLDDICKLGATCRFGHSITHDEKLWSLQVWRQFRLLYSSDSTKVLEELGDMSPGGTRRGPPLEGVICDPSCLGNREMAIIFSPDFRRIMIEKNGKQKQDPFRAMLEHSLADMLPKLLAFYVSIPQEEQCSARLCLFGPGIESVNTKLLVHKIVNARSSTFDAIEFIKGLPGGIGSGVRINYKHMYNFDLMCLYTNSECNREQIYLNRISGRLNPDLNRMLVSDPSRLESGLALQPSILKLVPTLHSVIFALDTAIDSREMVMEVTEIMRRELMIMVESLSQYKLTLPVVILACRSESEGSSCFLSLEDLIIGLKLRQLECPWGVFEVCVENMKGVEKGLDWVLHHLSKKRRDFRYHTKQGQGS